jgi:GMP synthase (glutamine-hydrolysing)
LLLASNATTAIQAAVIPSGSGVFWGVQYHPEISLHEVAAALRRDVDDLVSQGFVDSPHTLTKHAELIETLHHHPDRRDLAWRLGLDEQVTDATCRTRELGNFIELLVRPTRSARGRA